MIFDSSLDFVSSQNLIIYIASESLNLSFCLILLSLFFLIKRLDSFEYIFWFFLFLITPFIAFFINENIFPDIGGYLRCMRDIRDNLAFDEIGCQMIQSSGTDNVISLLSFKRGLPALLFSFVPIPSIATIASIGMINKLILFLTYVYVRNSYFKGVQIRWELLLLLLPSILVFSSIGLRDNLVLCIQTLIIFWIIRHRFFLVSFAIILLFMIKAQNGVVFLILYFGWFIFRTFKSFKFLAGYCFFIFLAMVLLSNEILATLNFFKLAFLFESGSLINRSLYTEINSLGSLILMTPELIIKGLLRPFPTSFFSLITFFENLIILIILIRILFMNQFLFNTPEFFSILLMTLIGLTLNALVIDNDFSFARYKYPFIYAFIIYIYYLQTRRT